MFSEMAAADVLRLYEDQISGEKIPNNERPTVVQLSSVRAKLMEDLTPAPDVAVFGPLRSARALSHVEDVHVDGMVAKRRVTGPTTMAEFIACRRVFRTCLLARKAFPPAPLEALQKKLEVLDASYPSRLSILAHATQLNLMEEWPAYREEVEELVRRGTPPGFWNPNQPWAAAIARAADDRHYWEDHFEKPCGRNPSLAAASSASALAHTNFIPPIMGDGFEEMQRNLCYGGTFGPYAQRYCAWDMHR